MQNLKSSDNKFFKNVGMIVSGTVFAQFINIIISPILTRIYSPETYGTFSTFNSLIAILSISASLDYQNAIPLEKETDSANNLLFLSFKILLVFCAVLLSIIFLFGDFLLDIINYSSIINYKYFLVIGVFFTGIYNILMQTAYRASAFNIIAQTKYSQCIFANLIKVLVGLFTKSSIGMILGTIIGQSAGITNLFSVSKSALIGWKYSRQKTYSLAIKYKKFPLFSAPNNYINAISNQMPILMLSSMFSSDAVGAFSLANQIVALPSIFIGTAIGQVFYSTISKYGKENIRVLKKECVNIFYKMFLFGGVIFTIVALIFPISVKYIFGANWEMTGQLSKALCLNSYGSFMIIPISRVLEIINQQQIGLFFNILRVLALFFIFRIANNMFLSIYETVTLFSIVSFLFYMILILLIFYRLNDKEI